MLPIGDNISMLAVIINSKVNRSQTIWIDTWMLRLPLSARSLQVPAPNLRQSDLMIIAKIGSRMNLGVDSHFKCLLWPFSSNLYANFSACFLDPISCTITKNCWYPACFTRFSSSNLKWWPKHVCILTQYPAHGWLMCVAENTTSSPWRVLIDLWDVIMWGITFFRQPCH